MFSSFLSFPHVRSYVTAVENKNFILRSHRFTISVTINDARLVVTDSDGNQKR